MSLLEKRLSELPARPGVYLMKNAKDKIIYVGKAKLLNKRVRSYFDGREHEGHRAASLMRPHVHNIEWIITETEEEALILEANLIHKYKPIYNVRQKDDKHYPYITLTVKEPFPRAFITRSLKKDGNLYFGPFINSLAMHFLLDMSTQLFHLRECKLKLPLKMPVRPCLNYHIGRCDAPCALLCTQEEYREKVQEAIRLFEGKRDDLLRKWGEEMEEASRNFDFETAAKKRDAILALQATDTKQKADAANAHLTLDVISIRRNEKLAAAAILEYREGVFFGRRHYRLECNLEQTESEILQEILASWYLDVDLIPAEIALETPIPEKEQKLIEKTLSEKAGRKISLIYPKRGEKVGFLRLAHANAEMLLVEMLAESRKYDEIAQSVFDLQKELGLKKTPFTMECVDISHLSGTNTVASLVAFKNGRPDKANYRKFIVKTVEGVDDFASMQEILERRIQRLKKENKPLPDLFVVDGGKGQVESVQHILNALGHSELPLIGLAKRLEEIVFPGNHPSIVLRRTSPALKLLQNIRDEAHRFAITFQRSKRKKDLQVEWLNHAGIGEALRTKILSKYRSPEHFLEAPPEDIEYLLGKTRALKIREQVVDFITTR
ncbi:MAG: excinuclease ABC subunit UvrC [Fibrobacter sp.]|jgi:excinuclease ABC subunit C|nr:excinuclease ABC subunit UvrC [Fibrobacter sp.]